MYTRGATAASLQFLLDGRVLSESADGSHDVIAPAPIAVEEVLEGAPMRATITARDRVIALSLSTDEFLGLLAENVELAEGIFHMLIQRRHLDTGHGLTHAHLPAELQKRVGEALQPVERLLLLQSSPLLAHATAAQLWRLSAIARPVPLIMDKEPLMKGGEAAILIVLSGSLRVQTGDAPPEAATPGDVIGMYETLGGSRFDATVTVTAPGTALRLDHDELFDLLADHTDLLQGIFSALMR